MDVTITMRAVGGNGKYSASLTSISAKTYPPPPLAYTELAAATPAAAADDDDDDDTASTAHCSLLSAPCPMPPGPSKETSPSP